MEALRDAAVLQKEYQRLLKSKTLSKKSLCDLCVPFRDKYSLSDVQTLRIARKEMELAEMLDLFDSAHHEVCGSAEDILTEYHSLYGEIVFPDKRHEGQSQIRREIYANPAGWMYSMNGLKWREAPMDIGKIDYPKAYFRRIPEGVTVGVSDEVKQHPGLFEYSNDNGYSWHTLTIDGFPSGHVWIYHGDHSATWFRRVFAVQAK